MIVAPIGSVDFKEIIEEDYIYVDKTYFFTRPRRFEKTVTMSMLNYFFNIKYKDDEDLFKNLNISKQGDIYLKHKNKYHVIYITLKDVKGITWKEQIEQIKQEIVKMYKEHEYVIDSLRFYNKCEGKIKSFTFLLYKFTKK